MPSKSTRKVILHKVDESYSFVNLALLSNAPLEILNHLWAIGLINLEMSRSQFLSAFSYLTHHYFEEGWFLAQ